MQLACGAPPPCKEAPANHQKQKSKKIQKLQKMPGAWLCPHCMLHVGCRFVMCQLGATICTPHAASVHKQWEVATLLGEEVAGTKGHLFLSGLLRSFPSLAAPYIASPHFTLPCVTLHCLALPGLTLPRPFVLRFAVVLVQALVLMTLQAPLAMCAWKHVGLLSPFLAFFCCLWCCGLPLCFCEPLWFASSCILCC